MSLSYFKLIKCYLPFLLKFKPQSSSYFLWVFILFSGLSPFTITYAQFDSLIFTKNLYLDRLRNDIFPLGDQNGDGYDDFVLYDCFEEKAKIFFGGNPIDTIPVLEISLMGPALEVIDINDDDKKDIVNIEILDTMGTLVGSIVRIYYGGELLDTIPDISFYQPPGASVLTKPVIIKDYNGDGREELVFYDANLPYTEKQYGTFYFYNTEAVFDTIPEYILTGDTLTGKRLEGFGMSNEDLDGDGKGDFTVQGSLNDGVDLDFYREFYKGNQNFNLIPEVTFLESEHTFDLDVLKLIKNVTGRNNADILTRDYDNSYSYYYKNTIWYGSFPIDTIPDIGINTQNQSLRTPMTFVNDYNGDGFNDLLGLTFPLQAKLWVGGRRFTEVAVKTWSSSTALLDITMLGDVGDIDGDGVQDIGIGLVPTTGTERCQMSIFYVFKGDTSVKGDTTTGVEIINPGQPDDYFLEEPYPNPFNSETNITFVNKSRCSVKLMLYDILGKEKATLLNEEIEAGEHSIIMNAEKYGLASGTYFIKAEFIQNNKILTQQTIKLIYIK